MLLAAIGCASILGGVAYKAEIILEFQRGNDSKYFKHVLKLNKYEKICFFFVEL